MAKFENNYLVNYLLTKLKENNDPRARDEECVSGHVDLAAAEFEAKRKDGYHADEAHESAMQVLTEGID